MTQPAVQPDPALLAWTRRLLDTPGLGLEPCAGDASSRSYFRVRGHGDEPLMVMSAPGQAEGVKSYLEVGRRLAAAGVRVPAVKAADLGRGWLLIEDLGAVHYLDVLAPDNVEGLYGAALDTLLDIQVGVPAAGLPPYDEALLRRELGIFEEWYLGAHLGHRLHGSEAAGWQRCCDLLVASALEQPRTFVHRDYHSRNLMVLAETTAPGVLDFQDALHGPVTYDLASLLFDCYVAWPRAQSVGWALAHRDRMVTTGVMEAVDDRRFLRWLLLMATQRHLKAMGIFARLHHRDGKSGYLADIPRTAGYVRAAVAVYPELAALEPLIRAAAAAAEGER